VSICFHRGEEGGGKERTGVVLPETDAAAKVYELSIGRSNLESQDGSVKRTVPKETKTSGVGSDVTSDMAADRPADTDLHQSTTRRALARWESGTYDPFAPRSNGIM
jgi:hypothetical protein